MDSAHDMGFGVFLVIANIEHNSVFVIDELNRFRGAYTLDATDRSHEETAREQHEDHDQCRE